MDIKDLMVGDFVHSKLHDVDTFVIDIEGRVPKDQPELEYTEAVSVWLDSRQCWERHYLDEIEPIPLTLEILKKNGFIKESIDFRNPLQYCVLLDGLWIDISGENFFEGKLEYIHQLQHALRLCEIEKVIVL